MSTHPVSARAANWLSAAFYVAVLAIAGTGCALAATDWLGWPLAVALPAVLVLELASVALLTRANYRQRLGERAFAYRLLAAGMGGLAIAINWFGHVDTAMLSAAFFAGFSALGVVYVFLSSADARRDQLRAERKLPPTAPVYGLVRWLRHPGLTWRARELALRDPSLALYGSLQAAADQIRDEAADAALLEGIRVKMTADRDPNTAKIAMGVLQPEVIRERLRRRADYDPVVAWFAADIAIPSAPAASELASDPAPAATPTEAPVSPAAPTLTGEIVPVQGASVVRIPSGRIPALARALKASDSTLTAAQIGEIVGRKESTVRGYLGGDTSAFPIIKSGGKDASENAPKNGRPFGFGETEMKS